MILTNPGSHSLLRQLAMKGMCFLPGSGGAGLRSAQKAETVFWTCPKGEAIVLPLTKRGSATIVAPVVNGR